MVRMAAGAHEGMTPLPGAGRKTVLDAILTTSPWLDIGPISARTFTTIPNRKSARCRAWRHPVPWPERSNFGLCRVQRGG
jgi:hypothetical protein